MSNVRSQKMLSMTDCASLQTREIRCGKGRQCRQLDVGAIKKSQRWDIATAVSLSENSDTRLRNIGHWQVGSGSVVALFIRSTIPGVPSHRE